MEELNRISEAIIGAAFEVSNVLGIGFLEKVYQNALVHELRLRGFKAEDKHPLRVVYKNETVGNYEADVIVENCVLIELKCCDAFAPEHLAQCLNYLRATNLRLAMLLNFQKSKVEVKRVSL